MNIIVIRADGSLSTRPDSTLMRRPEDFYLPDGFDTVTARPCSYIKMAKAGKAVRKEFAHRYFTGIGRGVLLTCGKDATYIDWSTYIFDGETPAEELAAPLFNRICEEIVYVTRLISVRQGDIIAIEVDDPTVLRRGDAYAPSPSLEFNIR
ncbi:MAG: hypothetical protein J5699_03730 [Bacteroidales bacterium]|nr:hypothetical protein [Bacteroidales bacterium]